MLALSEFGPGNFEAYRSPACATPQLDRARPVTVSETLNGGKSATPLEECRSTSSFLRFRALALLGRLPSQRLPSTRIRGELIQ